MTCDRLASCISFTSRFHFCLCPTRTDVVTEICMYTYRSARFTSQYLGTLHVAYINETEKSSVKVAATYGGLEVA